MPSQKPAAVSATCGRRVIASFAFVFAFVIVAITTGHYLLGVKDPVPMWVLIVPGAMALVGGLYLMGERASIRRLTEAAQRLVPRDKDLVAAARRTPEPRDPPTGRSRRKPARRKR